MYIKHKFNNLNYIVLSLLWFTIEGYPWNLRFINNKDQQNMKL